MGKTLLRQLQLTGSGEGKYTDKVGGSNVAASFGLPMQSGSSLLEDLNNMRAVLTDMKGDRWYLSQSQVTGSSGAQAAPTFRELATHVNASVVGSFKFLQDVVLQGTTPKLTIGDGGAEDTLLVFDGNAQDYRIGLDDGTDALEMGVGAAHGTTPALKILSNANVDITNDLVIGDDLSMFSDSAVIKFGASEEISLTHTTDTGITLGGSHANGTNFKIDNSAGDGDSRVEYQLGGTTVWSVGVEDNDSDKFVIEDGAGALGADPAFEIAADKSAKFYGTLEATTSFTIGSAAMSEADLEKLDGITAGTAAANKALVADGNIDITTLRNVTATGVVTAAGFTIGSAVIVESELEMIDGITAGTALASKALVVDSNIDIDTIRNIGAVQLTTSGRVIVDDTTAATSTTDGSLQTDGGLSVALDAVIGDDLFLLSDAAVLNLGAGSDVKLTHDNGTGGTLSAAGKMDYTAGAASVIKTTAGDLTLDADAASVVIQAAEAALDSIVLHAENAGGGIDMKVNSNVLVSMDADQVDFTATAATVNVAGQLNVDAATESSSTSTGALVVDGGVGIAKDLYVGDDLLVKSNAAVVTVGSDQPFTLTHANANNTALVTAAHRLAFGDAGDYISGDGTDISIVGSNEINLDATTIDINGLVDISGNLTVGGNLDINGTTTTIDTTNMTIEDSIIGLGVSGSSGLSSITGDRGIIFMRGAAGATQAGLWWDGTSMQFGKTKTDAASGSFVAPASGDHLTLTAGDLDPGVSNTYALGSTSLMWSDAFLGDGSVVNFNNGDVTLTHSANALTVAGGTLATAALTSTTIVASGIVKTDDSTAATTTTDGSLQTDGGLSVVGDAVIGDDVKLLSDSAILSLGLGGDATLTHDGTTGLVVAASPISINSTGDLTLDSTTDIVLDAAGGNFEFKDDGALSLLLDIDSNAGGPIFKTGADNKDLMFQQFDGVEVMRIKDNQSVLMDAAQGLHIKDISAPNTPDSGYGVIYCNADSVYFKNDSGVASQLNAVASIAWDDVTQGDAFVNLNTTSGGITLDADAGNVLVDSNAGTTTVDGHTGVTLQTGAGSSHITLDAVGFVNIDSDSGLVIIKDDGVARGHISFGNAFNYTIASNALMVLSSSFGVWGFEDDGVKRLELVGTGQDMIFSSSIHGGDLVFMGDSGSETARWDGSAGSLLFGANKQIHLGSGNHNLYGDGTDVFMQSNGNINLKSTVNEAAAIYIRENGGTSGGIKIHADLGEAVSDTAASVQVTSDGGAITLNAGVANAAAVRVYASNAAGGIDVDAGTGGIAVDTTGVLSIDSAGAASNISHTATAGGDFTIAMDGSADASLILSSAGTAADALQITTTAGGIDILNGGAAGGEDIDITSTNASFNVTAGEDAVDSIKMTGYGFSFNGGDKDDSFLFNNSPLSLEAISAPSSTTGKLYNVGGDLYFNGFPVSYTQRYKTVYNVTSSTHAANSPLYVNVAGGFQAASDAFASTNATLTETGQPLYNQIDVYLNGQLMTSGSTLDDGDYLIPGFIPSGVTTTVKFFFQLEADDKVSVISY